MAAVPENYELAKALLQSIAEWYLQQINERAPVDMVTLTRMAVLSLSQYSAVLAVDVGMTEAQFLSVNKANFNEAYAKAPKFG